MTYLEDHGLPLVQLKERRRELVVALAGSKSVPPYQIAEIAALQHAISAMEAVALDLDAEVAAEMAQPERQVQLSLVS